MKVFHISGARSWGGNEQQLIDLIGELKLKGVENSVVGVNGSVLAKICNQHNIDFISVKANKLNKFKNYLFLKNLFSAQKPDIIHLHTSDSLTAFVLADIFFKIKIPTVFSKKGMGRSSSLLSRFKYNYKNINAIICVSKKVKTEFSALISNHQKGKLKVIYDGISLSRIKTANESIYSKFGINPNKQSIIHIGNHVQAKSLPTLIEMMNVLVNEMDMKNVQLIQIGEFNKKITNLLIEKIGQYKLTEFVKLAGFVDEASSYIDQFDVFVMSSEREGFPLTIYESLYKKTVVVSTKAGGIPEILKDDNNGSLVEIGDYRMLAKKVSLLLNDENRRKEFEENGYKTLIENYTAQDCAIHTLELYNNLLK